MFSFRRWVRWSSLSAFTAVLVVSCAIVSEAQEDESAREKAVRVADILVALGAQSGHKIADLGSGDGFITIRIARAVAPAGRAYAVDIDSKSLDQLRERVSRDGITNIEIILSDPADPKLPAAQIDAVLIRNAYHEMVEYKSVLAGITKGLKPGGVLVIIEAINDELRTKPREQQIKEHRIAPDLVEADLREAGFVMLERQDPFTTIPGSPPGAFWLIRSRRP
jgi:ubiquinone/menaquinone biosynthesis C-methylase UbiE